jgi:N-glycosylase/DNA lyase
MRKELDSLVESTLNDEMVMNLISQRKEEFRGNGMASLEMKFSELTFCTLTANTSAEMGIRCQQRLNETNLTDVGEIRRALVQCKYRFPNTRSKFIAYNYGIRDKLNELIEKTDRRVALADTYMGIGMKEASHFLRNIGFFQYSILDKHIQRFLASYYMTKIKIVNRRDYERVEKLFMRLSKKYGMEPGIMDLVIWYIMTGKILK